MKQYEYRVAVLEFSSDRGELVRPLQDGERVIKTFISPYQNSEGGCWEISVLLERETSPAFPVGNIDRDELNRILKGDKNM